MQGTQKLLVMLVLGAALAGPAMADASVGGTYGDYASDGSIDGCAYSGNDLQDALGSVPTDIAQYDPRFKDALNKALAQRAAGCGSESSSEAKQKEAAAAGPDGSPKPPGSDSGVELTGNADLSSDHGFPAVLGVLAGLVALIIVATALLALRSNRERSYDGGGFFSFFSDWYWGFRDSIGR